VSTHAFVNNPIFAHANSHRGKRVLTNRVTRNCLQQFGHVHMKGLMSFKVQKSVTGYASGRCVDSTYRRNKNGRAHRVATSFGFIIGIGMHADDLPHRSRCDCSATTSRERYCIKSSWLSFRRMASARADALVYDFRLVPTPPTLIPTNSLRLC